jgi:hypothetical protein
MKGDIIIIQDITRFVRSVTGYFDIIERLLTKNCILISILENITITNMEEAQKVKKYIELSELEIKTIGYNVKTINRNSAIITPIHAPPNEIKNNMKIGSKQIAKLKTLLTPEQYKEFLSTQDVSDSFSSEEDVSDDE